MAKFDIKQAYEVSIHVKGQIDEPIKRAILGTCQRIVQHIATDIIPQLQPQPVDRGLYRAGWRAKPLPDGGAEITNKVPHAPIIEYGARAGNVKVGRAMVNALEAWVVRKGIASREDARGVAWAIAMNLKKKGIFNRGQGFRVLAKALKKFKTFFREEHAREVAREG